LATRRALHSIFPSCSPRSRDHRALHSFPTRRSSDLDREANLDLYVERTVALWRFVHPSVQAALELGYDEFQDRMEAGFAASPAEDRKSTRLNSSHVKISYAVFCLKKKNARRRGHNGT